MNFDSVLVWFREEEGGEERKGNENRETRRRERLRLFFGTWMLSIGVMKSSDGYPEPTQKVIRYSR